MHVEETTLIEQAKRGDKEAFLSLVARYTYIIFSVIRQYIRKIVGYEEEDLKQDILLKAFETLPKFRGDEVAFQCWLRRSTRGICLNLINKQREQQTIDIDAICQDEFAQALPDRAANPDEELRLKELRNALHRAIAELQEPYRRVVVLRDIEGLTYQEIAAVLKIEDGTVKSRLGRARAMLRDKLQGVNDTL